MHTLVAMAPTLGATGRRRSRRPEVEATRLRILYAAERLYAERGFEGTSLREIAIAAHQGNNNAVQYHFGGREKLIDAIFDYRVAQMESERYTMLDRAEADGKLGDARTLLAILSLPHLSLCDDRGRHPHAGFMLHYLGARMPDGTTRGLSTAFLAAPAMCRLLDLIHQRLATLPQDIARTRIILCALMFLNLLVQHDSGETKQNLPGVLARHARDTIDAMTAALCGPHEPE